MNQDKLFKPDFFEGNRRALLKQLPTSAVVILPAHTRVQRSQDTVYPFRQESNFWYLTGITEPDYLVVINKTLTYLIAPARQPHQDVFDGSADQSELRRLSGITDVYSESEGWDKLKTDLGQAKNVYTLSLSLLFDSQANQQVNLGRYRFLQRLKRNLPGITTTDISLKLTYLRRIKQQPEIRAIQQAIAITTKSFLALQKLGYESFRYEYEIEAELTYRYRQQNAHHGYEPIVANGKNACTLHYVKNDSLLQSGQLLLIDTGAELTNYSADITRVVPVGKASRRARQVYAEVLELQHKAMELFYPGASMNDIEVAFEDMIGASLRRLGLITSTKRSDVRQYYPHALSHHLGLDVHDMGDRNEPLQPGMVMTVEPGIYIPEEGIGVRIEDDILITKGGNQVLSADCPKLAEF